MVEWNMIARDGFVRVYFKRGGNTEGLHGAAGNFIDPVLVTASFKISMHEYFNHFFYQAFAYEPARNTDDIGIVMFSGQFGKFFPQHTAARTF